jgi:hypothetical protein
MKPEDINSLPSYLVNGEVYGPQFDPVFKAHGIRETIFTSTVGWKEFFFSNYYLLPLQTIFRVPHQEPTKP